MNLLANEKSPYLLQHAGNPVEWFPWGEAAFDKAKREDKPVFISIGYATCHWCHVMEKESFEDAEVAALMNENFVNIKIDREERPDVDAVYMSVCQALTGGGGWPLTVLTTPEKKPFFAGTYFPKRSVPGRIGMMELAAQIADVWKNRRDEIESSASRLSQALSADSFEGSQDISPEIFEKAFGEFSQSFDGRFGGFGSSPKFPSPQNLSYLLRYWKSSGNKRALEIAEKTLVEMRKGGIFDQIGFGFHRYSTDPRWLVPHFEKMLYDQALMADVLVDAYKATGKRFYERASRETLEYVSRDLTSPEGAFYCAEDADSDGEEGKFYVWTIDEIKSATHDADFAIEIFNATPEGNFYDEHGRAGSGKNILHISKTPEEIAEALGEPISNILKRIEKLRTELYKTRESRERPLRDDKILTEWNGMAIAAFAKAGAAFGEEKYIRAAARAADFISANMTKSDGSLYRRFRDGEAAFDAVLEDYAFYALGLVELYSATFDAEYLKRARKIADTALEKFADVERGGFFHSVNPDLIARRKELYDGATPSGSSAALTALFKLWKLTGETKYSDFAFQSAKAFAGQISKSPSAYAQSLSAIHFATEKPAEIVVAAKKNAPETRAILDELNREYLPNAAIAFKDVDSPEEIVEAAPFIENYADANGKPAIYVCRDFACESPVATADEALKLIREKNI